MTKRDNKGSIIKILFIRTLPIMTGYIVLGMGFGLLLENAGYSWWWALLMSVVVYSGTMQYLGVDLMAGGASIITTALMALAVNARYMFYGLSMIDRYKNSGWKKPFLIFGLTDENFALLCNTEPPEGIDDHTYCLLVGVLDQIYWMIGCVLGAVMGANLSINTTGVEFVMTALFVTVFVDQWKQEKNHIPALVGLGTALVFRIALGPDGFLIPTMIVILLVLLVLHRLGKVGEEDV